MKFSVVLKDDFKMDASDYEVLIERDSQFLPIKGDIIKVGHNLAGYRIFRVEDRVFRALTGKNAVGKDFEKVLLRGRFPRPHRRYTDVIPT